MASRIQNGNFLHVLRSSSLIDLQSLDRETYTELHSSSTPFFSSSPPDYFSLGNGALREKTHFSLFNLVLGSLQFRVLNWEFGFVLMPQQQM